MYILGLQCCDRRGWVKATGALPPTELLHVPERTSALPQESSTQLGVGELVILQTVLSALQHRAALLLLLL